MEINTKALKKLSPSTLGAMAYLRSLMSEYAAKPSKGMQYGLENKYVTWRFSEEEFQTLELIHLTDVQFGHVECNIGRLDEYIAWILDKPNRFVLLGGDMIDAANVLSPGQPWENICGPQGQVYKFCEKIAPIRHRILGSVGGNHERRGLKSFGDIGLLIAWLLEVPYSAGQQLIDVHFGKHRPFKIHLYHGRGAARTKGAKVMMLYALMKDYPGSQLYLVGHLHDCFILPTITWERMPGHEKVKMVKSVGAMSSSFLNFWGTYAEVAGMSANDVLMTRVILEPNGRFETTIR